MFRCGSHTATNLSYKIKGNTEQFPTYGVQRPNEDQDRDLQRDCYMPLMAENPTRIRCNVRVCRSENPTTSKTNVNNDLQLHDCYRTKYWSHAVATTIKGMQDGTHATDTHERLSDK